jgi:hypothetical protein
MISSHPGSMQAQGLPAWIKNRVEELHNSLVAFLHPKDTFGVLIELVEFLRNIPNGRIDIL